MPLNEVKTKEQFMDLIKVVVKAFATTISVIAVAAIVGIVLIVLTALL